MSKAEMTRLSIKASGDHRVYLTEYGIPTIQLGCGGVIISTLDFGQESNQLGGIGFSLGSGDIGQYHKVPAGSDVNDFGVFFQIIATSTKLLQVMIDRLTEAQNKMAGTQNDQ